MDNGEQTRNLKFVIAYNGAAYHGWQRQAEGIDTVQARLETAAGRVLRHPVVSRGASRTDAGVHAEGQVANIITENLNIPLTGMRMAVNSRLPDDIAVRSIAQVDDDFDASLGALGKTYRYRIHVSPQRPVRFERHRMTEDVDEGPVILEKFTYVEGAKSVEEVYNRLYPLYIQVVTETLLEIEKKKYDNLMSLCD